jgi:RNA polymerase sigma-70 factor (ECF subfamily)
MVTSAGSERAHGLEALFRLQRAPLWGLAYRLTGSVEDAEDVVQEAFVRLLNHPPDLAPEDLGPWLVRVTTNLAIDALRRRRRRAYPGPWLPAPLSDERAPRLETSAGPSTDPETRYGELESASYAFLIALEALSPRQRAVLLLRDVLGKSALETAAIVGASEGSVRILHLRARRALDAYDQRRCLPSAALQERHRDVLQRFTACLAAQDARGLEALFADQVETITDAGGEFTALARSLHGRRQVASFYVKAAKHRQESRVRTEPRNVNGLPALLLTLERPVRRQAPRTLLRCDLDDDGHIVVVHAILAPHKLVALETT